MVVAEQEMRGAIFHLPHIAKIIVPEVESQQVPEPQEIALLHANAPKKILVSPLAPSKPETDGKRESPVVARMHVHHIFAAILFHRDGGIAQEPLFAKKPLRFEHQVEIHHIALVKQEQLAHSVLARLDVNPVQETVSKRIVLGMHLRVVKGIPDIVNNAIDAKKGRRICGSLNLGRGRIALRNSEGGKKGKNQATNKLMHRENPKSRSNIERIQEEIA